MARTPWLGSSCSPTRCAGTSCPGTMLRAGPRGFTLAVDLPNRGEETFAHLARLERLAIDAGGALYPAKDARMSKEAFARSYSRLPEFARHVDPGFSSSFWRRVTQ